MESKASRNWVALLALAGLGLGLSGELSLKHWPTLPLACFIAGGVLLALAGLLVLGRREGLWSPRPEPMRAWEPVFFLALVLLAGLPRLLALADFPAGAGGYEGEMVGQLGTLQADPNYEPYMRDGDVNWPSLLFYEQLFCFKVLKPGPIPTRLPEALWGVLAVLAFYFAARALISPEAAAAASVMLAGSVYHLTISRSSFPSAIVTFAPVAAVAFLVAALRNRGWGWAALAGAAASLGLYGYFPGRGVMGFFLVWMGLCAWFLAVGQRPTRAQWLAFLAGCFVVGLPQFYVAVRHPHMYWDYVVSANPDRGQGLLSYLRTFRDSISPYINVFHIRGDIDPGMSPIGRPMLDFIQGWLFPLGLVAALCLVWRPVNAFIFGLFFVGILPAVMGGRGYAHPTTRRMDLAWPAVFLAVGLALEQVRRGLNPRGSRRRNAWLLAAFLGLGLVSYGVNLKVYFKDFYSDPEVLNLISHDRYRIYKVHAEHPGYVLAASPLYFVYQTWQVYFPYTTVRPLYEPEDLLRLSDDAGVDAFMDPLYYWTAPFLEAAVPGIRFSTEPMPGGPTTDRPKDPFEPGFLFTHVVVPPGAFARARGMELDGRRVDTASSGFSSAWEGRRVHLRAVWLAPRPAGKVRLDLGWPGFRATLDGHPFPLGRVVLLDGGMHELTLEGRVPKAASGPLPLEATFADQAKAPPLLYSFRWPYGLLATVTEGRHSWGKAPSFQRRLGASIYRFHDIAETFLPFSVRLDGILRVPRAGTYSFVGTPWSQMRIFVGGRLVFDDMPGEPAVGKTVSLDPGRPEKLGVDYEGYSAGSEYRAVELKWKIDGGAVQVVPPQSIETPPWKGFQVIRGGDQARRT